MLLCIIQEDDGEVVEVLTQDCEGGQEAGYEVVKVSEDCGDDVGSATSSNTRRFDILKKYHNQGWGFNSKAATAVAGVASD